ncbi:DUF1634 domain-containing protein [Deminuibacter soli]|uniref:DUF1634 domain-containing protein n=1 Tax=Deminuibacter soli TaxID=2291815 RepID=A0A3E1NID2_9BACT|nr:DUF1634 domain-containing protein [Deminuibacter soli]RFM27706.1 DUF1634 domain-containing protein [Deminuibacter soli]
MPLNTEDKKLELLMGNLLRLGVLFSAALVFIGGILYLFQTHTGVEHYHVFNGETTHLLNLTQIFHGILRLEGASIIQAGVLLLLATPVARIILSVFGFMAEKDYLYVFITLLVLGIITLSILSGKG